MRTLKTALRALGWILTFFIIALGFAAGGGGFIITCMIIGFIMSFIIPPK